MCAHMCMCVSVRPEADCKCPLLTLVFETGFLKEPLVQLGWLAKGYQRPSSVCPQAQGPQA